MLRTLRVAGAPPAATPVRGIPQSRDRSLSSNARDLAVGAMQTVVAGDAPLKKEANFNSFGLPLAQAQLATLVHIG